MVVLVLMITRVIDVGSFETASLVSSLKVFVERGWEFVFLEGETTNSYTVEVRGIQVRVVEVHAVAIRVPNAESTHQ